MYKLEKKLEYLILSQEEMVEAGATDWKQALETTEEALRLHSTGGDVLPFKVVLRWGDLASEKIRGHINAMPAYVGGDFDVIGIKWIGGFPESALRGQPLINGLQIINDAHTGWPLAIMDGSLVTSMRTAAVVGIGIKYLAKKDSQIISVIGTGVEGRTHTLMIPHILPQVKEIKGFDIRTDACKKWASELTKRLGLKVTACNSVKEALKDSDVIMTCAGFPRGPVPSEAEKLQGDLIEPGTYIGRTAGPPIDKKVLSRCSKLVVDDWQQIKHRVDAHSEPGVQVFDTFIKDGMIYGQLGEVISGKLRGREPDDDLIVLMTVGMGTEDAALGYRIYQKAVEKGLGTKVTLWESPIHL